MTWQPPSSVNERLQSEVSYETLTVDETLTVETVLPQRKHPQLRWGR